MFFNRQIQKLRPGGVLSACAVMGLFAGTAAAAPTVDDDKIQVIIKLDGQDGLHRFFGSGDGPFQAQFKKIIPELMAGKMAGGFGAGWCDCDWSRGGAPQLKKMKMLIERLHGVDGGEHGSPDIRWRSGPGEDGPHKIERRIEIHRGPDGMFGGGEHEFIVRGDGPRGTHSKRFEHEIHIESDGHGFDFSGLKGKIGGKVIIVGPDGEMSEFRFGDDGGHRARDTHDKNHQEFKIEIQSDGGKRHLLEFLGDGPFGRGDKGSDGDVLKKIIIKRLGGTQHEVIIRGDEPKGVHKKHLDQELHIRTDGHGFDFSDLKGILGGALKGGDFKGKAIFIGPDGVKREIDLSGEGSPMMFFHDDGPRSDVEFDLDIEDRYQLLSDLDFRISAASDEPPTPGDVNVRVLTGDFERPIAVQLKEGEWKSQPTVSVVFTTVDESGDAYKVVIKDGDVSAYINGKAVPADRIRRTNDSIEILGEDGEVLNSFKTMGSSFFGSQSPLGWRPATAPRVEVVPKPRVMLGVTMSQPGNPLREHFELDEDGGILIDGVIEGLPAAKAGLKKYDIIVAINGRKPATQQGLRKLLSVKDPGDQITLTIIRKGKAKELLIELEGYKAERLGGLTGRSLERNHIISMPDILERPHDDHAAEAYAALEEAFKNFNVEDGWFTDERALKQFEQAMRQLEEKFSKGKFELQLRKSMENLPEARLFENLALRELMRGDDFVFSVPGIPKEKGEIVQQQIAKMEQRLKELDAKLGRIDSMLRRLIEQGE